MTHAPEHEPPADVREWVQSIRAELVAIGRAEYVQQDRGVVVFKRTDGGIAYWYRPADDIIAAAPPPYRDADRWRALLQTYDPAREVVCVLVYGEHVAADLGPASYSVVFTVPSDGPAVRH